MLMRVSKVKSVTWKVKTQVKIHGSVYKNKVVVVPAKANYSALASAD